MISFQKQLAFRPIIFSQSNANIVNFASGNISNQTTKNWNNFVCNSFILMLNENTTFNVKPKVLQSTVLSQSSYKQWKNRIFSIWSIIREWISFACFLSSHSHSNWTTLSSTNNTSYFIVSIICNGISTTIQNSWCCWAKVNVRCISICPFKISNISCQKALLWVIFFTSSIAFTFQEFSQILRIINRSPLIWVIS